MLFTKLKKRVETVFDPKIIALIGATASGKSALAVELALQTDAMIFSIDSLSIYKEVDIVSAKPTLDEQKGIIHRGIDEVTLGDHVSAFTIATLYKESLLQAKELEKDLIIVGGSSFYLKALLTGLSALPDFSETTLLRVKSALEDLPTAYEKMVAIDPIAMRNIEPTDRYRIEKNLLIFEQTRLPPSVYFEQNPAVPIIDELPIFSIKRDREALRQRIAMRTKLMLQNGVIDEVASLESNYSRSPLAMGAIGIKETLAYLDGRLTFSELEDAITTHTSQLAKRQTTFNSTQFLAPVHDEIGAIYTKALHFLRQ